MAYAGTGDVGYQRLYRPLVVHSGNTSAAGNVGGTTLIDMATTIFANDYFNESVLVITQGTYAGQWRDIIDFVSATGTITVAGAFPGQIAAGTRYGIISNWAIRYHMYEGVDSSGLTGDASGAMMEALIYLAQSQLGREFGIDGAYDLFDYVRTGYASLPTAPAANASGALIERLEFMSHNQFGIEYDGTPNQYDVEVTGYDSTAIAANASGSMLERLEFLQEDVLGSEFGRLTVYDVYDVLATGWDSSAIGINIDGSITERLEFVQNLLAAGGALFTTTAATTTTLTDATLADVAGQYIGQMAVPLEGAMAGEGRLITAYNGTTMITVSPAWAADPDAGGAIDFVIMPTALYEVMYGGKGVEAIFDTVDAIPDGSRVSASHAMTAYNTEDVVWTIAAPGGVWFPEYFVYDLSTLTATSALRIRSYYRVTDGGNWLLEDDFTYTATQVQQLHRIELHNNRWGVQITASQAAGIALLTFGWESYYSG